MNETSDGTAHCIKAQYWKSAQANFIRSGNQGATGVIQVIKDE